MSGIWIPTVHTCFVLQEESVIDAANSDFDKVALLQDYAAAEQLSLCHGRLKQTCDVALLNSDDILIERLQENIVVRSINCDYVLRKSSATNNRRCDFCTKLQGCVATSDFNDSTSYNEDSPLDCNSVSKPKPTTAVLEKLISLNLPVTVSISSKAKTKSDTVGDKSTKKLCVSTTVIKKKIKSVIEIRGPTVTNTCSWCGKVFHRLYLFKDHLKVRNTVTILI